MISKDTIVSVLLRYLHPSHLVQMTFPNQLNGQRLEGCVVVGRQERKINRKMQTAIIVHHEAFKNEDRFQEVYAVAQWFKLQVEGPRDLIFQPEEVSDLDTALGDEEEGQEMPAIILQRANTGIRIEVDEVLGLPGVDVDDDRNPAPENVPHDQADGEGVCVYGEWGHGGLCYRLIAGAQNSNANLRNFPPGVTPSLLQLFQLMLPKTFLQQVVLPQTNLKLQRPVGYGEFLRWIGLWLMMATTHFDFRRDFWSRRHVSMYGGAPFRFNDLMTRNRFEEILVSLKLTEAVPPTYVDWF